MAFACFLHDAEMLETLLQRMQPALFGQPLFRVWVAGCPSGVEPYSLAMALREQMPDAVFDAVRIYATDGNLGVGDRIEAGMYLESEIKSLPYPVRYRYFHRSDKPSCVRIAGEIRDKVAFMQHDLLTLSPIRDDFSLVVCKEPLNRFGEMERRQIVQMFHRSLRSGGLLAFERRLMMSENMGELFEPVSTSSDIFRRVDASEISRPHVDRTPYSVFSSAQHSRGYHNVR